MIRPTDEELLRRRQTLLALEADRPIVSWYLSFVGEEGWRGACIVEAQGIVSALSVCNLLGINPGGEVMATPVPRDHPVASEFRGRLLSKEDVERCFPGPVVRLGDL